MFETFFFVSTQSHVSCVNRWKKLLELSQVVTWDRWQADICLFKANNGSISRMCRICLKITIKTTGRRQQCHSGVFIVNFERIKNTTQKTKFSIKDFFSKYDQIRRKLLIWSHLLEKSLMTDFIFWTVKCFEL